MVATGIDGDAMQQGQEEARPFSLNQAAPRAFAAPTPAPSFAAAPRPAPAPAPAPTPIAAAEPEALDLGVAAQSLDDDAGADELLLDPASAQLPQEPAPFVAPPAQTADPVAKAPRVATGGGTLFERMSSLSRGGARSEDEGDDDGADAPPLNIPRFLGRQNNQ
ncbi:hypothetical protein [Porphyrobacter sp. CCH7-A1]|uniref:hypothetical protein n=1 Tax=Porphyrobacter sp. CCH7-A1 TaxID=1768773 RepID=UPI000829B187|nr:hypothetical protein [Porphyrobacter sp. CCH7-A1]